MCLVNDRTRWTLSPPLSAAIYIRPLIKTLTVVMRCWHFQHLRREVRALQERRQQNKREPQQHTKTTPTLLFFFLFVFFCLLGNRRKDASNLHKFVYSSNKSGRIHAGHDENSHTHTHTYNLIFSNDRVCCGCVLFVNSCVDRLLVCASSRTIHLRRDCY